MLLLNFFLCVSTVIGFGFFINFHLRPTRIEMTEIAIVLQYYLTPFF